MLEKLTLICDISSFQADPVDHYSPHLMSPHRKQEVSRSWTSPEVSGVSSQLDSSSRLGAFFSVSLLEEKTLVVVAEQAKRKLKRKYIIDF